MTPNPPKAIAAIALPVSKTAERTVLGSMLTHPECIGQIVAAVKAEHFDDRMHSRLFALLVARHRAQQSTDIAVMLESCREALERCVPPGDSLADVAGLLDCAPPSMANLDVYLSELVELHQRRQLVVMARELAEGVSAGEPLDGLLSKASDALIGCSASSDGRKAESLGTAFGEVREAVDARLQGKSEERIGTGIAALDKALLGGLSKGELCIVAGPPGGAKTAAAMGFADHAALRGHSVLVFSTEMTRLRLAERLAAQWADVPAWKLQRPSELTESEAQALGEALQFGEDSVQRMYIDDREGPTLAQISARCEAHKARHGLDMVVVDYLQILGFQGHGDLRLQIGRAVTGLLHLAKRMNCSVVLLSQLSREQQKQKRKPVISDLKETSQIEQDANLVIFPWKPDDAPAEMLIAKIRNGSPCEVPVHWDGSRVRFVGLEEVEVMG